MPTSWWRSWTGKRSSLVQALPTVFHQGRRWPCLSPPLWFRSPVSPPASPQRPPPRPLPHISSIGASQILQTAPCHHLLQLYPPAIHPQDPPHRPRLSVPRRGSAVPRRAGRTPQSPLLHLSLLPRLRDVHKRQQRCHNSLQPTALSSDERR